MEKYTYFLNPYLKVLNFTHIDLDGAVSAIVLKQVYNIINVRMINYNKKEQEALDYARNNIADYDCIIFTDFCPNKTTSVKDFQDLGKPVLVLDHHTTAKECLNIKENVFIDENRSGAKLAYDFYKKYFKIDYLEQIVNVTDDYDRWVLKNKLSFKLNAIYWYLGFNEFINKFAFGLKFDKNDEDFLANYAKSLADEYDKLAIQNLKNGMLIIEVDHLAEISYYIQRDFNPKYLIMVWPSKLKISIRSKDIPLSFISTKVGEGGGHDRAMGYYAKNGEDFKHILDLYIKYLDEYVDINMNK